MRRPHVLWHDMSICLREREQKRLSAERTANKLKKTVFLEYIIKYKQDNTKCYNYTNNTNDITKKISLNKELNKL